MSTKTSTSETNGLTRVWGFTDALFNLVGFHTKSQFSLMDHIQQFLQANNFSMRTLLEQVIIFFFGLIGQTLVCVNEDQNLRIFCIFVPK